MYLSTVLSIYFKNIAILNVDISQLLEGTSHWFQTSVTCYKWPADPARVGHVLIGNLI